MAPDASKKKPKTCKKYAYAEHSKYSKWEKDRRDRFNIKLDELATILPHYKKEWKKVEIVENAISHVNNKTYGHGTGQEDTIKQLSLEVNQLKNVIMCFTKFKECSEDIYQITSKEVSAILQRIHEAEIGNEPTEIEVARNDENLAFVANLTNQSNVDHSYSIKVSSEPSLQVDSEEVVETVDISEDSDDINNITLSEAPVEQVIIDLGDSISPENSITPIETEPLPLMTLHPAPALTLSTALPQIINLADLTNQNITLSRLQPGSNVTTIFVNKGSRASILQQANTLPLIPVNANNTDSLPNTLGNKIQIPRLRNRKTVVKPKKRGPKKYSKRKKVEKQAIENLCETANPVIKSTEGESNTKPPPDINLTEAGPNNDSEEALPPEKEVIDLQNNEEMEILEETLKEDAEKSQKDAHENEVRKKQSSELVVTTEQKKKRDVCSVGSKKKSKSSYSIAALCQISVNIGDRPEMANSPGVLSLNSVGTISPSNTPAPTPDLTCSKSFGLEGASSNDILIGGGQQEMVHQRGDGDDVHVLEELRTIRPEDVALLQQVEQQSSNSSETKKNPSPRQSILTNLPEVSKQNTDASSGTITPSQRIQKTLQRDIYQALNDLDKEFNMETDQPPKKTTTNDNAEVSTRSLKRNEKNIPAILNSSKSKSDNENTTKSFLGNETPSSKPSISSSKSENPTSTALSVYDFSATKPETPPIPLQKARNKEAKATGKVSKAAEENIKPNTTPEKKTYTEMQIKPKKSPNDGRNKYSEGKKQDYLPTLPTIQQPPNPYLQPNPIGVNMEPTYDTRIHHHQQEPVSHMHSRQPGLGKHSGTLSSNYHQPPLPTTYNSQHPAPRHSYMAPHYPYQAMVPASQHTNPNIHPYHHSSHPYNHAPVGPIGEPVDMKSQVHPTFHHNSKYPCTSHAGTYLSPNVSDFHARNYYTGSKHYTSSNPHYRNFHEVSGAPPQQIQPLSQHYNVSADRKRSQQQMDSVSMTGIGLDSAPNIPMQQADNKGGPPAIIPTAGTTFSVTQLVNSNQQRKGTKRGSSLAAKPSKQPRTDALKDVKTTEKDDCRKRASSSRRNKSGTRSNYSAESLISTPGASTQTIAENRENTKLKTTVSPSKNIIHKGPPAQEKIINSAVRSNTNWSNDINHMSGLQFSSLSPSPASLFPPDLSSIDFPMSIFNPQETSIIGSKPEYLQSQMASSISGQNTKGISKQQSACQRSSVSSVSDWTLNPAILDNSFLHPLPTLTPPNDPMSDPMAGYSFMSPMTHSHTGFYPCTGSNSRSASAAQAPAAYSAHSAANITVSGYSPSMTVMSGKTISHHHSAFPPSQMVAIPPLAAGGNTQTSSLVNFNLSTIFPEINIPAAAAVAGSQAANCGGQVVGPSKHSAVPGIPSLAPGGIDFLQAGPGGRPGQLATPDLLPHSLALLGHSSHNVMPAFTMATTVVPGLTFPNIVEQ